MKILHVLGKLDRGGVETWLVQLLSQIDRTRYPMDFAVHTTDSGAYDDEVKALGAAIIPCLGSASPLEYAHNFRQILRTHGPYDCVHSHVRYYSGYVLLLARLNGVPIRIAHTHTANPETAAGFGRKFYRSVMRYLINRNATAGIAVSTLAGDTLLSSWKNDPRWRLIPYGVDTSQFANGSDQAVRSELGIPAGSWVVGHVGRFCEVKNHRKIVAIAKVLCASDTKVHFLLVGDGPLRQEIEAEIAAAGLARRFTLSGLRSDVPRILKGAMDAFLFPSKYEGLPIALIEAQLAGLPCVASDAVTPEAALDAEMVTWIPLAEPAERWASTLEQKSRNPKPHGVSFEVRERMSIKSCSQTLEQLYDQLATTRSAPYRAPHGIV